MSRRKPPQHPPEPPLTGYSQVAKTVLQEGASRVEEMHRAIAAQSFDLVKGIPLAGAPARLVQQAHDAIAGGVYTAIRQGGGGLLDLAAFLEKPGTVPAAPAAGDTPPDPPSRLASGMRSALNAAFGDHFAETNNILALTMDLRLGGQPVALHREALARAYPAAGDRVCVFIHGLWHDEHCWEASGGGVDMPRQVARDTGHAPLTLRYNTGLPIVENGAQLAVLLAELLEAWPVPLHELVLIGHSMGGLVARSACTQAAAAGLNWLERTRMVICLGSPHLGSPVERLGELATTALGLSAITAPLGQIAAQRSQGIQDLRHGLGPPTQTANHIAWRFVGGSVADDPDDPLGEIIGDGLVTLSSATAHELTGDVDSVRLGGVGHMELIKEARVYRRILAWLKAGPGLSRRAGRRGGGRG